MPPLTKKKKPRQYERRAQECPFVVCVVYRLFFRQAPQWGAADAKIKVISVENTELKGFSLYSLEQVSK